MFSYIDLIGVPFTSQGRDIQTGFDCYGLTKEVYRRFGYDIGEYWCDVENKERINNIFRQVIKTSHWQEVDYKHGEDIPVPALIALRFNSPPGIVNHTGVYIGNGQFIHTRERIGCCVDHIDSVMWKRQIEGIYKFIE